MKNMPKIINENTFNYLKNLLTESAASGDLDSIKYAIEQGMHADTPLRNGGTAIGIAARKGHTHCVKFLASQCIDIDHIDNLGQSALDYACLEGHTSCLRELLGFGAKMRDSKTSSSLQVALLRGHIDCAKLLVDHGISVPDSLRMHNDKGYEIIKTYEETLRLKQATKKESKQENGMGL